MDELRTSQSALSEGPVVEDVVAPRSENARYFAESLKEDSLRLLEIHTADYDSPVSCTLHVVNFNDNSIEYSALSYCWGENHALRTLKINGLDGFVTTDHVYAALRRLRSAERSTFVWVDSVCINQDDNHEKSYQVQRMSLIYSRARWTMIWLGEIAEEARTCRKDRNGVCVEPKLSSLEHPQAIELITAKIETDEKCSLQREHLMQVWWKRLWVIQEFAASREIPLVMVGPHTISWDFFKQLRPVDQDEMFLDWKIDLKPERLWDGSYFGHRAREASALFDRLRGSSRMDLYSLLVSTSTNFWCKAKVDRIFALLSLVDDRNCPLRADYSKHSPLVFAEVAMYLVQRHQTVDVLVDLDDNARQPGHERATWVPSWDRLIPFHLLKGCDNYAACSYLPKAVLKARQIRQSPGAREQGLVPTESCQCISKEQLTIKCLKFDRIVKKVDMKGLSDGPDYRSVLDEEPTFRERLSRAKSRIKGLKMKMTGRGTVGQILDALCIDYSQKPKHDLQRVPYIGYLILDYIFNGARSLAGLFDVKPGREGIQTATEIGLEQNSAVVRDLQVAHNWEKVFTWKIRNGMAADRSYDGETWETWGSHIPSEGISRVIFSTEDGFVGVGPGHLEPGDEIVVPFGSSRPWILRSHGNHYVFVGPAVVPGIMSGKLEALYESKEVSAAEYTLL